MYEPLQLDAPFATNPEPETRTGVFPGPLVPPESVERVTVGVVIVNVAVAMSPDVSLTVIVWALAVRKLEPRPPMTNPLDEELRAPALEAVIVSGVGVAVSVTTPVPSPSILTVRTALAANPLPLTQSSVPLGPELDDNVTDAAALTSGASEKANVIENSDNRIAVAIELVFLDCLLYMIRFRTGVPTTTYKHNGQMVHFEVFRAIGAEKARFGRESKYHDGIRMIPAVR